MNRRIRISQRRGTVTVEAAIVLSLMLSLVFGVFEFSRLLLDWNLINNAAREGCRYAIANNTSSTISTDVQTTVTGFMAGRTGDFSNFTVTVSGTHLGVSTPVNNLAPGDNLTVTVSGTFKFLQIIPLAKLPTNLAITSSVVMGCEGGL